MMRKSCFTAFGLLFPTPDIFGDITLSLRFVCSKFWVETQGYRKIIHIECMIGCILRINHCFAPFLQSFYHIIPFVNWDSMLALVTMEACLSCVAIFKHREGRSLRSDIPDMHRNQIVLTTISRLKD